MVFQSSCIILHFSQQCMKNSVFNILAKYWYCISFWLQSFYLVNIIVVLISSDLIANTVGKLFLSFLAFDSEIFSEMSIQRICPFHLGCWSTYNKLKGFFIYYGCKSFSDMRHKYFILVCGFSKWYFWNTNFLILVKSYILILFSYVHCHILEFAAQPKVTNIVSYILEVL